MVRGKVRGLDIVSTWVEFGSTGARSGRKSLREEMAEFALSSRPAKCPKSSAGQSLASARIVAEYLATSGVQFRTWLPHFELLLLISSIVSPSLMNQRGLGVFLFIIYLFLPFLPLKKKWWDEYFWGYLVEIYFKQFFIFCNNCKKYKCILEIVYTFKGISCLLLKIQKFPFLPIFFRKIFTIWRILSFERYFLKQLETEWNCAKCTVSFFRII